MKKNNRCISCNKKTNNHPMCGGIGCLTVLDFLSKIEVLDESNS